MISGEFKDLYTEDTQRMIDRRFKTAKETEEHLEKLRGIADRLAQRYNVDAADADALTAAIDADDSLWQDAADEAMWLMNAPGGRIEAMEGTHDDIQDTTAVGCYIAFGGMEPVKIVDDAPKRAPSVRTTGTGGESQF